MNTTTSATGVLSGLLLAFLAYSAGAPTIAQEVDAPAPELVVEAQEWIQGGARPDWSARGDWVAFDRRDADGRYQVWARDVVAGGERCITCDLANVRKNNNLSPAWHPSGEYLAFLSQSYPKKLDLEPQDLVTPDRGLHTEIYLARFDRKGFWQLTRIDDLGSAALDPHFSFDGDRLAWAERMGTKTGHYGSWRLRTAKLAIKRGVPRLGSPKSYRVGDQEGIRLAHEFSPDDQGLLISGNLQDGQPETGIDLYRLDLGSRELTRLTRSRPHADGHAHVTPRGEHVVWSTNIGQYPREPPRVLDPRLLRDLWIMRIDGSEKSRLTHFNASSREESLGEAWVGDFSFSPEGHRLAVHVMSPAAGEVKEAIWLLTLDESFRR